MTTHVTKDLIVVKANEERWDIPIHKIGAQDWSKDYAGVLAKIATNPMTKLVSVKTFGGRGKNERIEEYIAHRIKTCPQDKLPNTYFYIDQQLSNLDMTVIEIRARSLGDEGPALPRYNKCFGKNLSKTCTRVGVDWAQPEHNNTPAVETKKPVDRYREAVIKKLDEQINKGVENYGQLLQDNESLNFEERLTYLQEELIDGAQYVEFVREKWGNSQSVITDQTYDIKYLVNYIRDLLNDDTSDNSHTIDDLLASIYWSAEKIEGVIDHENEHGRQKSNK